MKINNLRKLYLNLIKFKLCIKEKVLEKKYLEKKIKIFMPKIMI